MLILTEQVREEFQFDGVYGAEHISQWQCTPTDHVMVSADTAEVRYHMIPVGSLVPTSSTILLGQLRLTVTTGKIITYMRET